MGMSDFLMRDAAPLSAEQWEALDKVVVKAARQYLVGRRFIELVGPMGAGTETVPVGTGESRRFLELEVIQHDFTLSWRDIEANQKLGLGMDWGPAAMAAAQCALDEDRTVLNGLIAAAGTQVSLAGWSEPDGPLQAVVQATNKMVAEGCFGPYAVVLNPALYAETQRVHPGMGQMVGRLIKEVAEGGIYRSPVLGPMQGVVLSLGDYNFDLVIGQDLITAYAGNDGMDHLYRVMESLVLRVKRPGAICALTE
jgi:uncharacterized linocin/CFP29 family protein